MKVLYLGWWNEAAQSLARHHGETTFVVEPHDAAAATAHPAAGRVVVVSDPTRADDVVSGLQQALIDTSTFDVVCTEYEHSIVSAAILAKAFGSTGLPVVTAVALRDKAVQKHLVRRAGLPVADCYLVADVTQLPDTAGAHPFVIKPPAGAGSQLTYAVHDQASLDRAVRDLSASGQNGPWLVEEFVEGAELHMDGVVRAGEVLFMVVSRYLQNVIAIHDGGVVGSIVVDPGMRSAQYQRSHELVSAVLKAVGHRDGVFHLEAFDQADRLVFSECAGRIGGGMVFETTAAKFGVDLYDEWARAVLGLPTGIAAHRRPDERHFGWIQLAARPGRVISTPDKDDLQRKRGVVAAQLTIKPGDSVPDSTRASHLRAARVVMTGESDATLEAELMDLWRWFRDQVQVVGES